MKKVKKYLKKLIKLYKINKKVNKIPIYNINKIKNYIFYIYLGNKKYFILNNNIIIYIIYIKNNLINYKIINKIVK